MVEESLDQASKCHHTVVSLHTDITVLDQEVLLDRTEDIQVPNMVDQELLQVSILVILVREGHNHTVLVHKEAQVGLLIQVGLRLILKEV